MSGSGGGCSEPSFSSVDMFLFCCFARAFRYELLLSFLNPCSLSLFYSRISLALVIVSQLRTTYPFRSALIPGIDLCIGARVPSVRSLQSPSFFRISLGFSPSSSQSLSILSFILAWRGVSLLAPLFSTCNYLL